MTYQLVKGDEKLPRTKEAFRQIRDERREELQRVAVEVFGRQGYVGTKIDDIAAAAGVSKGLVYHYFAGKEALFATLVEGAAAGTARLFEETLRRPGSAADRLRWLIAAEVSGMTGDPYRYLVILQALLSHAVPGRAREAVLGMIQQEAATTEALIREGQQDGEVIPGDPHQLFLLLGACLQGMAASMAAPDLHPTLPTTEALVGIFIRPRPSE